MSAPRLPMSGSSTGWSASMAPRLPIARGRADGGGDRGGEATPSFCRAPGRAALCRLAFCTHECGSNRQAT